MIGSDRRTATGRFGGQIGRLLAMVLLSFALLSPAAVHATTRYVSLSGGNVPPYTNWAMAATNIQYAIDVCASGDVVIVTNGVYDTGGRTVDSSISNRIAITNEITVKSSNGPEFTAIDGSNAMRVVWLAPGGRLIGFEVRKGWTLSGEGAGLYCTNTSAVVSNCWLRDNEARSGGGAYGATLYNCSVWKNRANITGGGSCNSDVFNCQIYNNTAGTGGGVFGGEAFNSAMVLNSAFLGGGAAGESLVNCSIINNFAGQRGGGLSECKATNCIVLHNHIGSLFGTEENVYQSTLAFSCTTPAAPGPGNIVGDPGLVSRLHVATNATVVGAGDSATATGSDIDDQSWAMPPAMGCDEPWGSYATNPVDERLWSSHLRVPTNFVIVLQALLYEGLPTGNRWDLGDGRVVTNRFLMKTSWAAPGEYEVRLTAWNADHSSVSTATQRISVVASPTHFVDVTNANPVFPYTNWVTAARTIQDAIDCDDLPGRIVLVREGVYTNGGRFAASASNRIVLTNGVIVRAVGRPDRTIIEGRTGSVPSQVRCAFIDYNTSLEGFTLRGGAGTHAGGAYCSGQMKRCVIVSNHVYGISNQGNAGVADRCVVAFNRGGGCALMEMHNCVVIGNVGSGNGGGAWSSRLANCLVTGNMDTNAVAGGVTYCIASNSIIVGNAGSSADNFSADSRLAFCCAHPLATGQGNFTNDPRLVIDETGMYDLDANSPCIDAGSLALSHASELDFHGRPRVMGGSVDVGPFEFRYEASLKGLLAGAWAATSGAMRTGIVSTNSPYASARGEDPNLPSNSVDWVLISVRGSPTGAPVASVNAFMMPDGSIRGRDNTTNVYIEAHGALYGVLQHRNHLAVMSAMPVFTSRVVSFDFSADPNLLWGGTNAVVQVSSNRWGMIPGDADGDGAVRPVDELIRQSQAE